jgi:glyoxylase-like metal-dependent hydrolase (beta-lactamase superfamily II)
MDTITLGDVEVARVYEHQGVRLPREFVFPGSDPALWRGDPRWVEQDFWDAGTDELLFNMQTWVLRSEGRTILVDTGIGDSKERPGDPVLHHRESDFLANLAAVGVAPEDVDVVVCTHVHGDHVGWNTRLVDGEWIPTFGNAPT